MRVLNPTPASRLTDAKGRPYFLWDMELTLDEFRALLRDGDDTTKAWLIGKLMRQAKPDDVFEFVTLDEIRTRFAAIERHLGRSGPMWKWLLTDWAVDTHHSEQTADQPSDASDPELANKLGALLHRAELRDLVDVEALLGLGLDLGRAIADAARKDGGFSPVTLGWALAQFPVAAQAKATSLSPERAAALEVFRADLARRVAYLAKP
ncbi:MAG: hypothetical protein HZB39_13350 [Planctomycetes bacterium]|nr:hypothetical protein [Planctomycetota bacterium]